MLLVTNVVGDIAFSGNIDLRGHNPSVNGKMFLYAGGDIIFNDLKLTNVFWAVLSPGGSSYINGLLSGTNDTPVSGLVDIGTTLRTPAGKTVYYSIPSNPALNEQTLVLANLGGTAGAGGWLRPLLPKGTLIMLR
jgi:hypothetical protein